MCWKVRLMAAAEFVIAVRVLVREAHRVGRREVDHAGRHLEAGGVGPGPGGAAEGLGFGVVVGDQLEQRRGRTGLAGGAHPVSLVARTGQAVVIVVGVLGEGRPNPPDPRRTLNSRSTTG